MKDALGGRIVKEFLALRPNMDSYLKVDGNVEKMAWVQRSETWRLQKLSGEQ